MSNHADRLVKNHPHIKVITHVDTNAINNVRFAAFVGAFIGSFFFSSTVGRVLTGG